MTVAPDNEGMYYALKLEEGLKFQDHVTDVLYEHGMVIVTYVSKARGLRAENRLGVEIKRDGRFRETGNLCFETAEKSRPGNPNYVSSGIYRDDNAWLYLIGDEKTMWVFSKKFLQELDRSGRYRTYEISTSRGFLMPVVDADRWCARRIDAEPVE